MCRAAIETLEKSLAIEVDQEFLIEESRKDLFEKVAVAQEMTPEEAAAAESLRQSRKRQYTVGKGASGTDWDQQGGGAGRARGGWKTWLSGFLLLLVVAAFGVNHLISERKKKPDEAELAAQAETERLLEEFQTKQEKSSDDGVEAMVTRYQQFDQKKMDEAVRGFLTASTVAEKKAFVRDQERVSPLMDDLYSRTDYEPRGLETINRQQTIFQGDLATLTVQNADFLNRSITVERVVGADDDSYKVDWESWVGYSEFTPEEMRKKKPTEPFLIRAVVSISDYYNYGFSDDSKWRSYGLQMGESGSLFLGYVPVGSPLDKRLSILRVNGTPEAAVLKVAYPPKARAQDQVEILEVINSQGWLLINPEEANDE